MSAIYLLVPILFPMLAGGILLILPRMSDRRRNLLTEAVTCVNSIVVFVLIALDRGEGITIYSFTQNFAVGFRIDGMGALFSGMAAFMWPLAMLYAFSYMEHAQRRNGFFGFYLMTYGITLGIAFAQNLVTMYVFFEMLTLVTIPLVSHIMDPDSLYAGRLYAAYCIGGAALAFVAVVMGTLDGSGNFNYGGNLVGEWNDGLMQIIFLFGFFGFGTKAALFPLFRWLPTASVAPTPVTALLHAVAVVNSGAFAVTRLIWYAFGPSLLAGSTVYTICMAATGFSMLFGAVMAMRQRHLKRRLAYSTMSNLSYILYGVLLLTPRGLTAGLAHMLFHGIIKIALFYCAGALLHTTGREYIYEVNGMGRRMPFTFACYTLGALSLSGIPLFCGFHSKWRLLMAGVYAGTPAAYFGAAMLIAAAFLCVMYSLTISVRAFFPATGTVKFYPGELDAGTHPEQDSPESGSPESKALESGSPEGNAPETGSLENDAPENGSPIGEDAVTDRTEPSPNAGSSAGTTVHEVHEADWRMLVTIGVFTALSLLFGLWPDLIFPFLEAIGRGLV